MLCVLALLVLAGVQLLAHEDGGQNCDPAERGIGDAGPRKPALATNIPPVSATGEPRRAGWFNSQTVFVLRKSCLCLVVAHPHASRRHSKSSLYLDQARTGLSGWPLFFLRTGVALVLAVSSYHLLERPIREKGLAGILPFTHRGRYRSAGVVAAATLATVAVILIATIVPTSAPPSEASVTVAPALRSHDPIRMLLVGDSMALFTGLTWQGLAPSYGVRLYNYGVSGCGLTPTSEVMEKGRVVAELRSTFPYTNFVCADWPALWAHEVRVIHPQVVSLLVRSIRSPRSPDGRALDPHRNAGVRPAWS